jgi:hypothetical protein
LELSKKDLERRQKPDVERFAQILFYRCSRFWANRSTSGVSTCNVVNKPLAISLGHPLSSTSLEDAQMRVISPRGSRRLSNFLFRSCHPPSLIPSQRALAELPEKRLDVADEEIGHFHSGEVPAAIKL